MKWMNSSGSLMILLCCLINPLLYGQSGGQEATNSSQPNIIFILVDDMGWGDLGVFWQNLRKTNNDHSEPWQSTPALDALAAKGAMLTSHYCSAPVCAPSRASLLLGVSQGHANVRDNQFDKALQDTYTLGSVMQGAGYHTAAIGKWGLQGKGEGPDWPAHPLNRGFDYYLGYIRHRDGHEHYPKEGIYRDKKEVWENRTDISPGLDKCLTTDLWTASAKRYITQRVQDVDDSQPFFLYLAYDVPHAVLELPTQKYPDGGGLKGGLQWTGRSGQMINTASGEPDSYIYPEYRNRTWDDDKNPNTAEVPWPETYQRYATACRRIDEGIGDLMQLLQDLDIDDNTLVVFSSDNGPSKESYLPKGYVPNEPTFFNSFGPFDGIKRDLWEGGVRVPTIACWPARIPAGQVFNEPSAMYDWLPTITDAAGLLAPVRTDGVSLLPLLSGTGEYPDRTIYIEYFNNQKTPDYDEFDPAHRSRLRSQMQKIRIGDFAGVRYNIQSADDDFEIYNVVTDQQETTNLAGQPAFRSMQAMMKEKVLQMRMPDEEAKRPYDSTLVAGVIPRQLRQGLQKSFYKGKFPWLAEPQGLTSNQETITKDLVAGSAKGVYVLEGFIRVPEDGRYTFSFRADGPFLIRLHEAQLLDGSYKHQASEEERSEVALQAGFHPIRIYYLQETGGQPMLKFKWKGPGMEEKEISAEYFFH
ncbi:MAG: sulfatase-like hydrolase/transferase [Saprospiraceae bacterium]|nr:sulfatase-like hydrolase/transferase [Lewinella sp.]